jgi:hypothetical protein
MLDPRAVGTTSYDDLVAPRLKELRALGEGLLTEDRKTLLESLDVLLMQAKASITASAQAQGVVGVAGSMSTAGKAVEAVTGTKSVSTVTNRLDDQRAESVKVSHLKSLVANDPLCGQDLLASMNSGKEPLVICSRPVDALFEEYIHHSSVFRGAVLCFHDVLGNGKSTTVAAIARGRHLQAPKRFLVVSPSQCRETGSGWLEGIKSKLGIAANYKGDLAHLLEKALLSKDITTDDKFRVEINGERRHPNTKNLEGKLIEGRPLLVLEDLNPEFFSHGETERVFDRPALGTVQFSEAREAFGADAFDFLNDLAVRCYNHGWVVIVTTRYPRVAKFLHIAINGGDKFKISRSLLVKEYDGKKYNYFPETFLFEDHFAGMWNDASKTEFLLTMFPDNLDDIIAVLDDQPNISIRSYCNHLSTMRVKPTPTGLAHATSTGIQRSGSRDAEEAAQRCCSFLPEYLGGSLRRLNYCNAKTYCS